MPLDNYNNYQPNQWPPQNFTPNQQYNSQLNSSYPNQTINRSSQNKNTSNKKKANGLWLTFLSAIFLSIFVIIGILFSLANTRGFTGCLDFGVNNNICFNTVSKQQAQQITTNNQQGLSGVISKEQELRNQIRDLWEEQAAINDDLVLVQVQFAELVNEAIVQADRNIRFENDQARLLSEFKESDYQRQKEELKQKIAEIEAKIARNAEQKEIATKQIAEIYAKSGQVENNRFAPQ